MSGLSLAFVIVCQNELWDCSLYVHSGQSYWLFQKASVCHCWCIEGWNTWHSSSTSQPPFFFYGSPPPVVVEAVAPGVTHTAEGGLRLAPALALQSLRGHGPAHLAPIAVLAPTHDPGLQARIYTYIYTGMWFVKSWGIIYRNTSECLVNMQMNTACYDLYFSWT